MTLLERDRLPDTAQPRSGVPQGRQPHILLRRGLLAAEVLLPGLQQELLDAGGVAFNTGRMPQRGQQGWLPQGDWAAPIVSLSRTRLEQLVRRRVLRLPGVDLVDGVRVSGLTRLDDGWDVVDEYTGHYRARWVIDASGRGSRLPGWLRRLGVDVGEPEIVEARLGYACRTYRGAVPLQAGVLLGPSPDNPAGGTALPIEDGRWLICAAGYGERRPGREPDGFEPYLDSLSDPALADLARCLDAESDVALHRQTGNRRHGYGRARDWPPGLLVVGDALCAFNPIYGQGITVAALQAESLADAFGHGDPDLARTRRLQGQVSRLVEVPWLVATTEDRRYVAIGAPSVLTRLTGRWTSRVGRLAVGGDLACCRAFGRLYHLTGSPAVLFGPAVVAAVLRSWTRPLPLPGTRPTDLTRLAALAAARSDGTAQRYSSRAPSSTDLDLAPLNALTSSPPT